MNSKLIPLKLQFDRFLRIHLFLYMNTLTHHQAFFLYMYIVQGAEGDGQSCNTAGWFRRGARPQDQGLIVRAERDLQIFSKPATLSSHETPDFSKHQVSSPTVLHVGVKVPEVVDHPIMQHAGVHAVANPHKQGLVVRAKRDPGDLAEEVNLLPLPVALVGTVDMHKVGGLGEEEEPAVGGVADAPDRADVASQDLEGGRRVPDVPDPAGLVLVPGREGNTIRVPCRGK